ncbi:MAG TPA: hypothetical protein VKT81_05665 [Bryobacteraceae bacterium]|nr:hypothetical protein [Bryobacteraceae bacterium]
MRFLALTAGLILLSAPVHAADTDSIDSVMKAVYEVISGPAGAPRDWARFKALFADGGRLIPVRTTKEGTAPAVMTPEDYEKRGTAIFEKTAFYETEVSRRLETFGDIAHAFSTYESRHAPGEKPFARGINSFQLVKVNGAWKVMTIFWEAESPNNPIPEKYDAH